jgi:hypothetical protein
MHGPTFFGDGADSLMRLADYYEKSLNIAVEREAAQV